MSAEDPIQSRATYKRPPYKTLIGLSVILLLAIIIFARVGIGCEQRAVFVSLLAFAAALALGTIGRSIQLSGKLPALFGSGDGLAVTVVGSAALFLVEVSNGTATFEQDTHGI